VEKLFLVRGRIIFIHLMREMIDIIGSQFLSIHERSKEIVELIPEEFLFAQPRELDRTFTIFSCGEYIIRSAASVEQCFGGMTTRLWDDPFEWTLREALATKELIDGYLDEVEASRTNAIGFLASDDDLLKQLPAPEKIVPVFELLLDTIRRAEHYQGRAAAVLQYFSDKKLPRI
jgi:hypothetical protein